MSLDVFMGIAGVVVTVVVAGMLLITPRGAVPARRANKEPRQRDPALAAKPVERAIR